MILRLVLKRCFSESFGRTCKYPRGKKQYGAALAVVLMVVTLAVVLGFSMAGTGIFQLNVSSRLENELKAKNLADSALAKCIEKVIVDEDFGKAKEEIITIQPVDGLDGAQGVLTFDEGEAAKRHIPYSKNNLSNHVAVEGWGKRVVPENSVHIIATGIYNGVTRKIETIIHIPPFPFVIASSGKFSSTGKLIVAGVADPGDISSSIDPGKLLPGNLLSNSSDSDAVVLSGEGKITGNVQTSGAVVISPDSTIEILGEIAQRSEKVKIQKIDLHDYDPKDKAGVQHMPDFLDAPTLEGYCRKAGNLVISGDLSLKDGLLFVEGNLQVSGGVNGNGALVVIGTTHIQKGASLSTDNLVALLSTGDIKLGGLGSTDYSSFQGVVYTEGNFTADNISLFGVFISGGSESSLASVGNVSFNNTSVIQIPEYAEVEIAIGGGSGDFTIMDMINHADAEENKIGEDNITAAEIASYDQDPLNHRNCTLTSTDTGGETVYIVTMVADEKNQAQKWEFKEVQGKPLEDVAYGDCRDGSKAPWVSYFSSTVIKESAQTFLSGELTGSGQSGEGESSFKINAGDFLNRADRIKQILWREL